MIRILVIDDLKENLLVLEAMLISAFPDCLVTTTTKAKQGIKKAQTENPDVILLDLFMPEMDGFETCKKLKEDDLTKAIPVIILTAESVNSEDRTNALTLGAEAFLSKPIEEAELIAQINAMIRIKQSEINARAGNARLEDLVRIRTIDLQNKLEEQRKTEIALQQSNKQLEISRLATFNLLEDIKTEIESRRMVEEEVRKLNAELEKRVVERTRQLENANKELEAFAYSVSHDLRAPLRAIDGFSKFILEDYYEKFDAEGKRLLLLIRTNTQRMDRLITDILSLSRVARSEHKVSKIDMTRMVMSMYSECVTHEARNKISFVIDPMPDAIGDPTYLKQVWTNLISNAVKFSSLKIKPAIKVGGHAEKGFNIYFIKDNGAGFNQEYAHKLFGVFQRLHAADEFEGTGVGLAIVQRIISRHGGTVWAEGISDGGATFYFSLPAENSDQPLTTHRK